MNVPIGIFGTYWSRKRLRELARPARDEKFDFVGAFTFSGFIFLILLGLAIGGIMDPLSLRLISLSIVLIVWFVLIER